MEEDRRIARTTRNLLEHWQFFLVLLGGAVACVKFYLTVTDLAKTQANWQVSSEVRREHARDILEQDHINAAVAANNIEWLKKNH